MKKLIINLVLCGLFFRLCAENQLSQIFDHAYNHNEKKTADQHEVVSQAASTRQSEYFRVQDEDLMSEAELLQLLELQQKQPISFENQVEIEVVEEEKKSEESLLANVQQFFMQIFAFLSKK